MGFCLKASLPGTYLLLLAAGAWAQPRFDKSIILSKENGLPTNNINNIKKGEDGFVWIATAEGLCRFDGSQVKVFGEGKDLRYHLFDKSVFSVQPVKNEIWAGTSQGLSVLYTASNTFRHYQLTDFGKADTLKRRFDQAINTLYKDKSGTLWIGTREKGLCMYDRAKDNFRFFSPPGEQYQPLTPSLGPATSILNIRESETNDSIIWAGTPGGLLEINKYTGEARHYIFPQKRKDYQVALNAFRRLYHHDDGLLYVGSWSAGVNIFNPVTKTFSPLEVKNEEGKKITNSVIGNLVRKSGHEIWMSTSLGLAVYDSRLKDVTWYKYNNPVDYEIFAINFIDEAGRAWYIDINGASYFDPAIQPFARYSYKQLSGKNWAFSFYIIPDKQGNRITVCPRFSNGLYHLDKATGQWTKTVFPGGNTFNTERDVVRGFVQLASGDYIISSDKGIFLYSENQKRLKPLHAQLPVATPTRRGEILLDRSGYLWVSDDIQGLIKWRPGSSYRIYKSEMVWNETGLSAGRIENLFEDSRGNIWFQRGRGIGVYLASSDSILNFIYDMDTSKSFPDIKAFAEDKKGRIWISGTDGWLGYASSKEPAKGIIVKLNIRNNGLSGDFPMLATDHNGEVWGYTSRELVKINAADLSFTTYSLHSGFNAEDIYHFSFLPSGEMIFGGRNDITLANPAALKRNTELPVPYITEVYVLNRPFNYIRNEPLQLKYRQNFFSIGFSAIAYTLPGEVKFRYRLKHFDDWNEASDRRFANYTNVPGGDYVFQLQAANNEGVWNDNTLELPVHISTALWQTWWFRTVALALIFFSSYGFYRYRINQLRKKQQLKSEYEKKLANVEMSALLAQMNPHFLFNSLNSIDSYIIRNEMKKASEYINSFARLMRLILQNSRSNYITLKDELEALELYMQMEGLRFQNKFSYSIKVDESLDTSALVIPPMLIQPYVENAIWHGLMHKPDGAHGQVEIIIHRENNKLNCIVQDNGIGRGKAEELKAQKSGNRKRSMGMQITKDRIEMINKLYGTDTRVKIIDLTDAQGQANGTRVELVIPV
jgi:ligand-binding sensor domain-containing protein/two-component sensor histidine kinase